MKEQEYDQINHPNGVTTWKTKPKEKPEALRRLADLESMHERGTIRRGHIDEMLSELRRLHALNQELLEALKTALHAFTEMHHAQTRPDWFTRGREAAVQHEIMWSQRGVEAVRAAIAKAQGASNE